MSQSFEIRRGMYVAIGRENNLNIGAYEFDRAEVERLRKALDQWLNYGTLPDESDFDPRAVAELEGARE